MVGPPYESVANPEFSFGTRLFERVIHWNTFIDLERFRVKEVNLLPSLLSEGISGLNRIGTNKQKIWTILTIFTFTLTKDRLFLFSKKIRSESVVETRVDGEPVKIM